MSRVTRAEADPTLQLLGYRGNPVQFTATLPKRDCEVAHRRQSVQRRRGVITFDQRDQRDYRSVGRVRHAPGQSSRINARNVNAILIRQARLAEVYKHGLLKVRSRDGGLETTDQRRHNADATAYNGST